jgi:hypothetical protein
MPVKPSFWKTRIRQIPFADGTGGICAQHAWRPPYGASGSPQAGIGVMAAKTTPTGTGIACPQGETST